MAVNWSRNFWNVQKTQICHQRKAAKKKKFATIPDNGLELNVNAFGMMDASTYSCIVRAVFLAWVGAKALPHCKFDSVRTGVL